MKFFLKRVLVKEKLNFRKYVWKKNILGVDNTQSDLIIFTKHFFKNGCLTKYKLHVANVLQRFHYFLYNESSTFIKDYPHMLGIMENFFFKNLNFLEIFQLTINLIKPPFVIKSISIPKSLRKKTGIKYLLKIVYRPDCKRLGNAFKQLYTYSNSFRDNTFEIRLYKAVLYTFFEWKNSTVYKNKVLIFKKYLKN